MHRKIFFIGWVFFAICLFLYSYTQVDLSLTLSRVSIYQTIEKGFQYIGYFNRPLSTYLYIGIIIYGFVLFIFSLKWITQKKIVVTDVWKISIILGVVLLFSYNALSYDLFNYIFDAKIITHYHSNPYIHKALDYQGDPMLSFMHWTHRVYPYGPFWLALTVPLSFLGFGYFLFTFFLFKAVAVVSYLVSTFYIRKINQRTKIAQTGFALAFFALNPLVIIESLVSAHNDIAMIALALVSLYFLFEKKYVQSGLFILLSIAIKFATAYLLPAYGYFLYKKKNTQFNVFFNLVILVSLAALVAVSVRTNFQPWYLLYTVPFAAFVANKKYILIPTIVISLFALFQYIPFLFTGNWNPPIPLILNDLLWISIFLSAAIVVVVYIKDKV